MRKWMIVLLVALFPTLAFAETTNFTILGYITELKAMPSAIEGAPTLLILKRRGVKTDAGGEKALYQMECAAFMYKDHTDATGVSLYTYDDGSTQVLKWDYTGKDENGDGLSEGKGTGNYISGTGRFEGMKGTAEFEAQYLTPYAPDKGTLGDMFVTGVSNYTIGQ
jgi:hypothetical protein